ncbi:uncharacterized protein LOC120428440 [Culex pipiens pallens]|uniref:uncharacterized protein LOC120428440 n=1 Tax=Culex pipiens pallens TaxID=42434 RepID=UPI00195484B7|nr:uncharacterized protein LOC120428440 [Culex pipiens pallens]
MEQKNEFEPSKPQTKIQVGQIYHEHKLASIYALFNIAYATKLLSKDEIRIVECLLHSENVLKAGIISHIKDEKPTFVHQTYAEFFVAKFIWEKYSACEIDKFESFVDLIFIKNFVEGDRSQITHFLLKIAQSEEQNDVVKVSKACVLLDQLLSLKLCSKAEFSKRSISFLLGIVECSIPEKGTEGFAKFKSIVNKKPKSRNILLLKAAENGYLKLVRLTMDDSPDDWMNISFDWLDGWTALHFAANGGHKRVVDYLLGKSAIVDTETAENGQTALHLAAAKGHSSIVEALLGKKANINARTTDSGATPLHLAAQQGSTEVVSKLLENGADKYATTTVDGETPLHVGCRYGHLGSVKLLIDNEQDINLRTTKTESTPLHVATENGHSAIANFLLEKGALVSVVTKDLGFTPLHFAAQNDLSETVSLLLDKDAPTDSISKSDGQTALHLAVTHRNANVVSLLLEKKANVNIQTENDGWTALHLAIRNNSYETVEMLLQYVTDINAINVCKKNQTLIHEAVLTGNSKLVKLILDSGADTGAENINKMTPRDLASNLDNQQRQEIEAVFNEHFNKDLTYGKRPRTAAIAGFNYELKILTMVLFRLLHDEKIDDFYLGSDIAEAGYFDDVVIRTRTGVKSRVYCLQAQHKNAGHNVKFPKAIKGLDRNDDFNLSKYFQSYLQIRHCFKSESNHVIFQGEYDQTELKLIMMTPARYSGYPDQIEKMSALSTLNTKNTGKVIKLKPSAEWLEYFATVSMEWHKNIFAEIIATLITLHQYDKSDLKTALQHLTNSVDYDFNCSNLLKLYYHKNVKANRRFDMYRNSSLHEKIYDMLDESLLPSTEHHINLVQDFFSKLEIYSEYATEDEMEGIIKRDILSKHYECDELLYLKSLAAVENWWKQTGEGTFLTKKCDFFEIAKHEIELDKIHLVNMEKVNSSVSINTHDVTMNPKLVECFKEIEEALPFFMNFFSTKPDITCLKLLSYVQSLGCEVKIVLLDKAEVEQTLSVLSKVDKPRCLFIAVLPEPDKVAIEKLRKKVNKLVVVTKHEYRGEWKSIEDKT